MAQFRASIQGTVSDPTGAIIPGATVTLTDTTTNHTDTATTNGQRCVHLQRAAAQ